MERIQCENQRDAACTIVVSNLGPFRPFQEYMDSPTQTETAAVT